MRPSLVLLLWALAISLFWTGELLWCIGVALAVLLGGVGLSVTVTEFVRHGFSPTAEWPWPLLFVLLGVLELTAVGLVRLGVALLRQDRPVP